MRRTRQEAGRTSITGRSALGETRVRGRSIRPLALGAVGGLIAALALAGLLLGAGFVATRLARRRAAPRG